MRLVCRTFRACWNRRAAKPRPEKIFWNSVSITCPIRLPGARAIAEFLEEYPNCTILATCRRHQNHGRFNGSIDDQLRILELAIESGARAIDVEIETAEVVPERCAALRTRAQLVVSWHHFETTPPLDPVLKRMQQGSG